MNFLVAFLFIQLAAFASPRDEAAIFLEKFESLNDTSKRMDSLSQEFLGLPYGDGGPLGEGPEGRYDQDPLYRFDTFDCTTYVETIVSLALSRDVNAFETQMDEIRYEHGEIDYLKRNHYPSLQWIPFNIHNGLLSEINEEIAPLQEIQVASAIINLPDWLKMIKINEIKVPYASDEEKLRLLNELHEKANLYSPVRANLNYVPIKYLLAWPEQLKFIPHGSIVNFVRPNWDLTASIGTHMNVSHQGLLFWKDGVVVLRHASNSTPKQVSEIPFIEYLKKFENHPTMKGVHFMRVN